MSRTSATFADLVARLDYEMFIVTAAAAGERAGCLVGFATQVSIHPERFLACLSVRNRTFSVARRAGVLAVHFVTEDATDLAELFGGQTGDEVDKFERCDWHAGPEGVPILDGLENWFAGRVLERYDFGDHWGFLLVPIEGQAGGAPDTMRFHRARRIEPGHEP